MTLDTACEKLDVVHSLTHLTPDGLQNRIDAVDHTASAGTFPVGRQQIRGRSRRADSSSTCDDLRSTDLSLLLGVAQRYAAIAHRAHLANGGKAGGQQD